MKKGPLLNNNSRKFTTRDSLGIESVAASTSRDIRKFDENFQS